jgi:hypothetical protein
MNIEEFKVRIEEELEKFQKDWEDSQKVDSDFWPSEMDVDDWLDQFFFSVENSKG